MTDLAALDQSSLRDEMRRLFRVGVTSEHWVTKALALHAVNQQEAWETWGYASLRSYAEDDLNLSHNEFRVHCRLLEMMQQGQAPIDRWRLLSKTKAEELLRVAGLAGDRIGDWVERAVACETTTDLRKLIDRVLQKDEWVVVTFAIPKSMEESLNSALIAALREVSDDPEPEAGLIHVKDVRHRLLEVLVANYMAGARNGNE